MVKTLSLKAPNIILHSFSRWQFTKIHFLPKSITFRRRTFLWIDCEFSVFDVTSEGVHNWRLQSCLPHMPRFLWDILRHISLLRRLIGRILKDDWSLCSVTVLFLNIFLISSGKYWQVKSFLQWRGISPKVDSLRSSSITNMNGQNCGAIVLVALTTRPRLFYKTEAAQSFNNSVLTENRLWAPPPDSNKETKECFVNKLRAIAC